MTARTIQQTPSHTALVAAVYRAIAHKDARAEGIGSDHLAWAFLKGFHRFLLRFGWIRRAILRKSEKVTPGVYEYVIARTAFFDARFAQALGDGTEQIVHLGAGYDSRPYRMAPPEGLRVIELDIASTQNRKRNYLARAGLTVPAGVVFAPIDFNTQAIGTVLSDAGYDPNRKTLFLWEGVTYYLANEAVDDVLRFVRENTHPGTTLTFDYAITLSDENIDRIHGARTFMDTWRKHQKGEPFTFYIDDGGLPSYLNERGFDVVDYLDASDMESVYSASDTGAPTGRITGFFRLATVRSNAGQAPV